MDRMSALGLYITGQVMSSEVVAFGDKQVQRAQLYFGDDKLLLLYLPLEYKVEVGKTYTLPLQGLRQDKYGKLVANLRRDNNHKEVK